MPQSSLRVMRCYIEMSYDHTMYLFRSETFKTDALLAIGLATLASAQILFGSETEGLSNARLALAVLMVFAVSLPMAFRRAFPTEVMVVSSIFWIIDRFAENPLSFLGVWTAFVAHAIGSEMNVRKSAIIGGGFVLFQTAFTALGAALSPGLGLVDVLSTLGFLTASLALGREVHKTRSYAARIEAQARLEEALRTRELEEGIRAERSRIARELHDIVGHQMTVMTLQAAGADRMIERDPAMAHEAMNTIEKAGRDAMGEMRRMLSFLREDEDEVTLGPQPSISRIPSLIGQMREAGLDARLTLKGMTRPLAQGIELSVFRIVQESLTNSLKHGGMRVTADVTIEYQEAAVDVTISDDGDGAAHNLGSAASSGLGLVGIRERATVLGGTFAAGPRKGGGYSVHVNIPTDQ
jgi:signal transduction histidine kinase